MYELGIIGGMGPAASASMYKRIIEKTNVSKDQDHISIVILNKPSIPDRSLAIKAGTIAPVKEINEAIKELKKLNVQKFIIACNTAHYFRDYFKIPKGLEFIDMPLEVLKYLKTNYSKRRIIVLATTGTIAGNIYNDANLNLIYPNLDNQKVIMDTIYNIKQGASLSLVLKEMENVIKKEKVNEDDVFLLACTEISMAYELLKDKYNVLDVNGIIADKIIEIFNK